ncbi:hypothetical protein SEA_NERGAL_37 [Mycobacterium Phage Nergal]|nr:hypothetical protein SEA_NERGAL_37 [Mycobacterium Phage Nergal]
MRCVAARLAVVSAMHHAAVAVLDADEHVARQAVAVGARLGGGFLPASARSA